MSDWRFEVDEVGEDAEDAETDEHIEPGTPSLENAVFVALGVLTTLIVFVLVLLG